PSMFSLTLPCSPPSTLFPYTTLFRSFLQLRGRHAHNLRRPCRGASLRPVFELQATDGAARLGRLATAHGVIETPAFMPVGTYGTDRKSTRLNSSHVSISYAVFCLKKK